MRQATGADRETVANLMQLCLYDATGFELREVDADGRYAYRYLDAYWTEAERTPLLFEWRDRVIGLALVRRIPAADEVESRHELAEFFMLRGYRRRGLGTPAARRVFDRFPGAWGLNVFRSPEAEAFWASALRRLDPPELGTHPPADRAKHTRRYTFSWPPTPPRP